MASVAEYRRRNAVRGPEARLGLLPVRRQTVQAACRRREDPAVGVPPPNTCISWKTVLVNDGHGYFVATR